MKSLLVALTLGCSVLLVSCGDEDQKGNYSKIAVGMTYDEVEDVLGKPTSIGRGASELYGSDLSGRYADWESVDDSEKWPGQPPHWNTADHIPGLHTVGELIYVRWDFLEARTDTIYYRALRKHYFDAGSTNKTAYLLNGHSVPKDVYDIADMGANDYLGLPDPYSYERSERRYRIVTFGGKDFGPEYGGAVKIISKRTGTVAVPNPKGTTIDSFYIPIKISSNLSVVFDASSGRVAHVGFMPTSVETDTPFRLPSIRSAEVNR